VRGNPAGFPRTLASTHTHRGNADHCESATYNYFIHCHRDGPSNLPTAHRRTAPDRRVVDQTVYGMWVTTTRLWVYVVSSWTYSRLDVPPGVTRSDHNLSSTRTRARGRSEPMECRWVGDSSDSIDSRR
jgi:hypothetical protein